METLILSRHATVRAQQRGIPHAVLDALMAHADIEVPVGGGCTALRLSRERLKDRELRASLGATADRLWALAVILSDETGEVVTVLRDHGGAEGRRYRRAH